MGNFTAKTELTAISQLPERGRALCRGYIESITIQPGSMSPQFTAVVTDVDKYAPQLSRDRAVEAPRGSHRVRLIWLGRRNVPGIEAGTELRFEGMVARHEGLPTVFNPRYEIIGKPEFQEYPA
ncbi:conserved hypothetical protein [Renibacterium salmoninarum ATCC 33209]|uniref:DNA-binding protein n=1 Tax=Renibacterium salmoninarum (strain ATCC 33209 / DSM 20767 / JCM 11484 / NBRC 15589 / NCIMB 2235) TaxID=288705 RepID=A9WRC0_RENSM|nr:OB-fold nucleic acid binding domain-containing protein [Renibacterium salmoninarum]ABY24129.1 conserved hypothetical protein [Renibacterium salmoninarum ATCC 33209]